MHASKTFWWLAPALVTIVSAEPSSGQNSAPAPPHPSAQTSSNKAAAVPPRNSVTFDGYVDSAIQQEHRLINLMRYYRPIVETYIQEEGHDDKNHATPRRDQYFLSRLELTGKAPANEEFTAPERSKESGQRKLPETPASFAAVGFAQAVFPDLDHFDRQNYAFEFVRWEALGEIRCAVMDVTPHANSKNRGFFGRIWVEDQDFNIVRFNGAYVGDRHAPQPLSGLRFLTSNAHSRRAFHFDSWRLNTLGSMWMPAYVYTEESDPRDPSNRIPWFKAQTRIWAYDLAHAGDHREFAKPLTDNPVWLDPRREEASQDLSPDYTVGKKTYTADDEVVERLQVAGLMAPDGDVDRILETVTNNLLITNELAIANVRCRVLLTTPLESFVVGRTIVLSRGLIDVLPDEAALAAVLAHELAHIVLRHSLGAEYLSSFNLPFSDLEIFAKYNFRFDPAMEADADKKGLELIKNSPYTGQIAHMALFLKALELHSPHLPNLLHGRFSNDFASSHLVGMPALATSSRQVKLDQPDQLAALPLGSRIKVDPWSDRIEMSNNKPVGQMSELEKMPFEVSPFFPYLRRLEDHEKDHEKSQSQTPP